MCGYGVIMKNRKNLFLDLCQNPLQLFVIYLASRSDGAQMTGPFVRSTHGPSLIQLRIENSRQKRARMFEYAQRSRLLLSKFNLHQCQASLLNKAQLMFCVFREALFHHQHTLCESGWVGVGAILCHENENKTESSAQKHTKIKTLYFYFFFSFCG